MMTQDKMTIDEVLSYLHRIKSRYVQCLSCQAASQASATLEALVASGPPSFPNHLWESCRSPYEGLFGDHWFRLGEAGQILVSGVKCPYRNRPRPCRLQ